MGGWGWLDTFFTVVAVLVALLMIFLIMLQEGKGGGLAALGGTKAAGIEGVTNPIRRATAYLAAIFFILMIVLGVMHRPKESRFTEQKDKEAEQQTIAPPSGNKSGSEAAIGGAPTAPAAKATDKAPETPPVAAAPGEAAKAPAADATKVAEPVKAPEVKVDLNPANKTAETLKPPEAGAGTPAAAPKTPEAPKPAESPKSAETPKAPEPPKTEEAPKP